MKPLEGVKVVELSTFVAGPVTARLLADLGAEVVKVEAPNGDGWRATGVSYLPLVYSAEQNPVFDIYNTGKRFVSLNLKHPDGKAAFHKLLETADVFVTNLRPGALQRLGIDYESLKEKYPRLVYGILLGYGEQGPDAGKPAYDTSAFWAKSGFLRDQGVKTEHYQPVQPPFSVGDTVSGYMLMGQICAALVRQKETGLGDYVRSGLYHNAIFTMGTMEIVTQLPNGRQFPDIRASHGQVSGDFECADGEWVYISGYSVAMYHDMHVLLGKEEWDNEERYKGIQKWNNREEYYEKAREIFLTQPSDYWLQRAKELDIPMVKMGRYKDLHKDEQAWANGYLENMTHPNGTVTVMPRSPIEMNSVGELESRPAAPVGADTAAVLKELGYTDAEIEAMTAGGAAVAAK